MFTDRRLDMELGVLYHGCWDSDTWHEGERHDESDLLGRGFSSGDIELQILDFHSLLGLLRDEAIDEIVVFCSSYEIESTVDLDICL